MLFVFKYLNNIAIFLGASDEIFKQNFNFNSNIIGSTVDSLIIAETLKKR